MSLSKASFHRSSYDATSRRHSITPSNTEIEDGNFHRRKRKKKLKTLDELINELQIDDHRVDLDKLCKRYCTDVEKGLSTQVAHTKNETYGLNMLTPTTVRFEFLKFLKCIFGGFSSLLWGGVLISFISVLVNAQVNDDLNLDNFYLGCIIMLIAVTTGCLTYYEQSKSSKIIQSFKAMVPQYATVTRNGRVQTIRVEELTKGDLVDIKSGDRVPADIRVITSKGFKVDIAWLNGENEPQLRSPDFTSDNPLETMNLVFFSSYAIEGTCRGIVINVGDNTVVGRIVGLASQFSASETRVAKEIRRLIRYTTGIAFILGIFFFVIESSLGFDLVEEVIGIVGIIVAIVPEGLPVTVTICQTLIAKRMVQKNCLVSNLEAVAALGSTSIIITDKTGCLTQNRMTVSHLWFDDKIFVSNSNSLEGPDEVPFLKDTVGFKDLARCAILCGQNTDDRKLAETNEDGLGPHHGIKKPNADAAEVAINQFMDLAVGDLAGFRKGSPKVQESPFNSSNKYQFSIHNTYSGQQVRMLITMKGAPERIFDRCSTIMFEGSEYIIEEEWRIAFHAAYTTLGALGERVLGFCDLILPKKYSENYAFDAEHPNFPLNSMRFLGMISLIDPPRASVPQAISICRTAGIKVIMVTGDHQITARAIARSVGIISEENETPDEITSRLSFRMYGDFKAIVIHGGALKDLTSDELDDILENYDDIVFARTTPKQKLALVEACQRLGAIVAVTGSTVTDAPSLQKGDIGNRIKGLQIK